MATNKLNKTRRMMFCRDEILNLLHSQGLNLEGRKPAVENSIRNNCESGFLY